MAAHRQRHLRKVYVPSAAQCQVPPELIRIVPEARMAAMRTRIPYRFRARFSLDMLLVDNGHDLAARKFLTPGGIFHGWTNQTLFSFRRAAKLGARLVLERPNTHPLDMSALVGAEQRKYGFKGRSTAPFEIRKAIREIEMADRVVVCSEFAKQSLVNHGVPEAKVRVINYGVDTEAFTPGPKHDNVFRIVYCGMVCLRKGPQYLLQAWKELALKNAEIWLLGVVLDDAVGMLKQYEGLPGLKIVGHVDSRPELAELYRQGTLFVFPSVEDGFGMVVTEAMACGVPVVISDNTGARDVVEEGVNGFVVPTRDVEAIKERILLFRDTPGLRETMGKAARATALNNTWYHYSSKLVKVYDELS